MFLCPWALRCSESLNLVILESWGPHEFAGRPWGPGCLVGTLEPWDPIEFVWGPWALWGVTSWNL